MIKLAFILAVVIVALDYWTTDPCKTRSGKLWFSQGYYLTLPPAECYPMLTFRDLEIMQANAEPTPTIPPGTR